MKMLLFKTSLVDGLTTIADSTLTDISNGLVCNVLGKSFSLIDNIGKNAFFQQINIINN